MAPLLCAKPWQVDPPLGNIDLKAVNKINYSIELEDKYGFEIVTPGRTYYCVCVAASMALYPHAGLACTGLDAPRLLGPADPGCRRV